jgi:hypothetical protein
MVCAGLDERQEMDVKRITAKWLSISAAASSSSRHAACWQLSAQPHTSRRALVGARGALRHGLVGAPRHLPQLVQHDGAQELLVNELFDRLLQRAQLACRGGQARVARAAGQAGSWQWTPC